ncbi:MAG TPA: hypothetical protein VL970_00525 [Candidatus Acidoferrales bacterium]|nr:hypothetical protein [Candidatus Acidoferrales bacterium]
MLADIRMFHCPDKWNALIALGTVAARSIRQSFPSIAASENILAARQGIGAVSTSSSHSCRYFAGFLNVSREKRHFLAWPGMCKDSQTKGRCL